jgi:hypothetical protein
MFILLTVFVLVLTALLLVILRSVRTIFSYNWLIAVGGAFLAWLTVFFWQAFMPMEITLSAWEPSTIFSYSPALIADGISWPFALSLTTLCLATILTSTVRDDQANIEALAGTLTLTALGLLSVLSSNPLSLLLTWAALDLVELVTMLRTFEQPEQSESAVVAFTTRVIGLGFVMWASVVTISEGTPLNFQLAQTSIGFYLLFGAGLRLGVLPLHLPYVKETATRRGFGTTLRLISAASSLILLARIPPHTEEPLLTSILLLFTALAAIYGGWKWLRAPDELAGRPYWLIGMASLAVAASLRANPVGSAAWGCALLLSGGLIFLYSDRGRWLTILLMISTFGFSALPFSVTASGWRAAATVPWLFWLPFLPAQALLIAGYIRLTSLPGTGRVETLPRWSQIVYPIGFVVLVIVYIMLGLWGWDGAFTVGMWPVALVVLLLSGGITWLTIRVIQYHGGSQAERPSRPRVLTDRILSLARSGYQAIGNVTSLVAETLEGDGGVLWTLLLLVLLVTIIRGSK